MDGPNSSTNLEFSGGGSEYAADEEFGKDSGASEKVEDVLSSFDYTSCYWYEPCVYCRLNHGYSSAILLASD